MLTHFNCPDKQTRKISECFEHCPRPEGRCLSLPTLTAIGTPRIWTGKPSTTQLLNPTRIEYLQITKPYAINPFDQAFALLGTRHHGRLEIVAKQIEGLESEVKLQGEVSGILDLLEPINGGESYRLIDYKTWGSYPTAKQLGIKKDGETDKLKLALQLNNYRMMAEELGFNVTELKCQVTVRDGNTRSARDNGINFNLIMIPVEILEDDFIKEYFLSKAYALITAVEKGELPEMCDYEERWNNRRCKGYCSPYRSCPEGAKVNKVNLEE